MNYDKYGRLFYSSKDLCDQLYQNPNLDLSKFLVVDPEKYNASVKHLTVDFEKLTAYRALDISLEEYHSKLSSNWYMPDQYKQLDIAKHCLDLCQTDVELQRAGKELILFQERELFDLLRFMKYLVDTLRKQNIVWGVGRGSSVASYVLYLLGVHKINSMYYELDIEEFLK